MQGKIYYNNADASLMNYRSAAWTFLYFDIDEVQLLLDTDTFFEYVKARVNYLGDYSEEKAN